MKKSVVLIFAVLYLATGCAATHSVKVVKQGLPKGSSIGVIVDADANICNVVFSKFIEKGYKIKGINASDLYRLSDNFTVQDYKYLAYQNSEIVLGSNDDALTSTQKNYDSIYKLHSYNYEAQKAEVLSELKSKWGLRYLVLIDFKEWEKVSWIRVIDLDSFDVVAIENYPTKYADRVDSITEHFIQTLSAQ